MTQMVKLYRKVLILNDICVKYIDRTAWVDNFLSKKTNFTHKLGKYFTTNHRKVFQSNFYFSILLNFNNI